MKCSIYKRQDAQVQKSIQLTDMVTNVIRMTGQAIICDIVACPTSPARGVLNLPRMLFNVDHHAVICNSVLPQNEFATKMPDRGIDAGLQ